MMSRNWLRQLQSRRDSNYCELDCMMRMQLGHQNLSLMKKIFEYQRLAKRMDQKALTTANIELIMNNCSHGLIQNMLTFGLNK